MPHRCLLRLGLFAAVCADDDATRRARAAALEKEGFALLASNGRTDASMAPFKRAVAVDPLMTNSLIQLGIHGMSSADEAEVERAYVLLARAVTPDPERPGRTVVDSPQGHMLATAIFEYRWSQNQHFEYHLAHPLLQAAAGSASAAASPKGGDDCQRTQLAVLISTHPSSMGDAATILGRFHARMDALLSPAAPRPDFSKTDAPDTYAHTGKCRGRHAMPLPCSSPAMRRYSRCLMPATLFWHVLYDDADIRAAASKYYRSAA
jgi:hypothetical protein